MTELFATGIQMGESPRWHDGRFWMCDWKAGEVLVFDANGDREVVAHVDGLPFSIDWLPDGRLVATTPTGVVTGPDLSPYGATGQAFNEIVVDAAGRAWVDMPGSMPWEDPKAWDCDRRAGRWEQPPGRRRRVVPERHGRPRPGHARCRRVACGPADRLDDNRAGRAG